MPCSHVQLARVVIVRVILADVVCVMLVVLVDHVDVVRAVGTVFVAIFVAMFCSGDVLFTPIVSNPEISCSSDTNFVDKSNIYLSVRSVVFTMEL